MEAVQTFRASGNVVAAYEAKMQALQLIAIDGPHSSEPSQDPQPAVAGSAPDERPYEPRSNPDGIFAWLFTPVTAGGTSWTLDLIAAPAEAPAADC